MASNTLTLQTDIASYLGGHSVFQYVPIICAFRDENAGDALLDDLVFEHLKGEIPKNGKFGLCVVINTPESKTTAQNAPGPIEDFTLAIQVIENKATNRASATGTGIRADDLYETINVPERRPFRTGIEQNIGLLEREVAREVVADIQGGKQA